MGEYFVTLLKPRILKAIYSSEWKDGKPVSRDGVSQVVKVLTLESYEDTLNNLQLRRPRPEAQSLFDADPDLREKYLLSYMLDLETHDSPSLLNTAALDRPFDYTLAITRGGESAPAIVDLAETFAYLLGLRVDRLAFAPGLRALDGRDPDGRRILTIWRTLPDVDDAALAQFFTKHLAQHPEPALDRVYVNGDCTLARLRPETETWTVHLAEDEFAKLMFTTPDV